MKLAWFPVMSPVGAILVGSLISCSPSQTQEPTDASRVALPSPQESLAGSEPFVVGIGTHLMGGSRPIQLSLDAVQRSGTSSMRDDAAWKRVEQEKGTLKIPAHWDVVVDEARARGIEPLLILDYGNEFYDRGDKPRSQDAVAAFTRYAKFVVSHFQGRVSHYEIWNEWDHTTGKTTPGTAEEYVRLLKAVYPELKKADPSATILAGSITPSGIREGFLRQVVNLRVLDSIDGLSLHTYVHCRQSARPEDWAAWMRDVENELILLTGKMQPLYITEMGWPTNRGACGVSVEQQADYLARLYLLARTMPFIRGIWWYDLQDDGPDDANRQHNFGLLRTDLSPKPAFMTLPKIAPLVESATFDGYVETGYASLRALRFHYEGKDVVVLWSDTRNDCFRLQKAESTESDSDNGDSGSITIDSTPKITSGVRLHDGTAFVTQVPC